jgi:hypothetical protein
MSGRWRLNYTLAQLLLVVVMVANVCGVIVAVRAEQQPIKCCVSSAGPKAQHFVQPRATPWGPWAFLDGRGSAQRANASSGERLARWAERDRRVGLPSPGRCPGLGKPPPRWGSQR